MRGRPKMRDVLSPLHSPCFRKREEFGLGSIALFEESKLPFTNPEADVLQTMTVNDN